MENEIRNRFEKAFMGEEFSVCDFGSCQYQTANITYDTLLALFKEFGVKEVLAALGIKKYRVRSKEEAEKYSLENIEDIEDDKRIIEIKTFEEHFEITKSQAWDLWSAHIGYDQILETEDKVIDVDLRTKGPILNQTFGPILNQIVQCENFGVGLGCALLTHFYNITPDYFTGFDT